MSNFLLYFVLLFAFSKTADFPSVEKSKRHQAQGCTDESICDNMDINGKRHDVLCHCASSSTSDPALLVLDAFLSCHPTKIVKCENFPSVMRAFSDLLDQLRGVSPEIDLHVKKEAFVFASDWYSSLMGSQVNPTEVVAFLQLIAIYKITDSFHPDRLLGLLEKVQPTERVVALVKIHGLTDEIQCVFPLSSIICFTLKCARVHTKSPSNMNDMLHCLLSYAVTNFCSSYP